MIEVVKTFAEGAVFELPAKPTPDQSRDRGRVLLDGLGDFRGTNTVSRSSQCREFDSCLNLLPPMPEILGCFDELRLIAALPEWAAHSVARAVAVADLGVDVRHGSPQRD